jgi:hypothetical protein
MIPLSPRQSRGKIGAAALVRGLPARDKPAIARAKALRFFAAVSGALKNSATV